MFAARFLNRQRTAAVVHHRYETINPGRTDFLSDKLQLVGSRPQVTSRGCVLTTFGLAISEPSLVRSNSVSPEKGKGDMRSKRGATISCQK